MGSSSSHFGWEGRIGEMVPGEDQVDREEVVSW